MRSGAAHWVSSENSSGSNAFRVKLRRMSWAPIKTALRVADPNKSVPLLLTAAYGLECANAVPGRRECQCSDIWLRRYQSDETEPHACYREPEIRSSYGSGHMEPGECGNLALAFPHATMRLGPRSGTLARHWTPSRRSNGPCR